MMGSLSCSRAATNLHRLENRLFYQTNSPVLNSGWWKFKGRSSLHSRDDRYSSDSSRFVLRCSDNDGEKRNESKSNSKAWSFMQVLKIVTGAGMFAWMYRRSRSDRQYQVGWRVFPAVSAKCVSSSGTSVLRRSVEAEVQQKLGTERNASGKISLQSAIARTQELCLRRKELVGSPGIVVCVSVDGRQVYAEGFGYADIENRLLMKPNSVLRIASISKAITAVIAAKQLEMGKLYLEKSVQHYVPEFPEKEFMGERVVITVRQLLNHTSGIRHYKPDSDPADHMVKPMACLLRSVQAVAEKPFFKVGPASKQKLPEDESVEKESSEKPEISEFDRKEYYCARNFPTTSEALTMFKDDPLCSQPGKRFLYTTFGYTLLSAVLEKTTGTPFPQVLRRTLHHLGLKETYLDENDPIIHNRARYYMMDKNNRLRNCPYVDLSYKWAGGGLLSTVEDMVKFGNILLYSAQHGDTDAGLPGYLKSSTVQQFWHPTGGKGRMKSYGLGFELTPSKENFGMCQTHNFGAGHSGGAIGVSSKLFILPRSHAGSPPPGSPSASSPPTGSPPTVPTAVTPPASPPPTVTSQQSAPQGVVVAVFVNMVGVSVSDVADEVARLFHDVDERL